MRNITLHICRGGRFYNAGHIELFDADITTMQELISFINDSHPMYIHCEDEDGRLLPDDEWLLKDGSGGVLLEGREAIDREECGILDFDGNYDTFIVKPIDECSDEECAAVRGSSRFPWLKRLLSEEELNYIMGESDEE